MFGIKDCHHCGAQGASAPIRKHNTTPNRKSLPAPASGSVIAVWCTRQRLGDCVRSLLRFSSGNGSSGAKLVTESHSSPEAHKLR